MFTRILKGIHFTMTQVVMVTAKKDGYELIARDATIIATAGSYVAGIEALEQIKLELVVMETIKNRWNAEKPQEIIPPKMALALMEQDFGYNMNVNHYVHFRDYGYQ